MADKTERSLPRAGFDPSLAAKTCREVACCARPGGVAELETPGLPALDWFQKRSLIALWGARLICATLLIWAAVSWLRQGLSVLSILLGAIGVLGFAYAIPWQKQLMREDFEAVRRFHEGSYLARWYNRGSETYIGSQGVSQDGRFYPIRDLENLRLLKHPSPHLVFVFIPGSGKFRRRIEISAPIPPGKEEQAERVRAYLTPLPKREILLSILGPRNPD